MPLQSAQSPEQTLEMSSLELLPSTLSILNHQNYPSV